MTMINLPRFYQNRSFLRLHKSTVFYKTVFLMDLLVLKRQRLIYYGFSKTVVFHGFVSYERTTVNQLRLYKNRGLNQINNGQNTTAL